MKSERPRLLTNVAPEIIDAMPVTVKNKMGFEIKALLKVEEADKNGLVILAHYDSNPYSDPISPDKFYLTQYQLDDFLNKGPKCVLDVPQKT
ncbi:MAG: hypothetical protein ACREDS_10025 [Limisphaerales bacterium]